MINISKTLFRGRYIVTPVMLKDEQIHHSKNVPGHKEVYDFPYTCNRCKGQHFGIGPDKADNIVFCMKDDCMKDDFNASLEISREKKRKIESEKSFMR